MSRENDSGERSGPCDGGPVVHRAWHDRASGRPLSTEVVRAVAAAAETAPTDLDDRLGDTVDADALDDLFEPTGGTREAAGGRVWFELSGFGVVVHGSGEIEVRPLSASRTTGRSRGGPRGGRRGGGPRGSGM